MQIFENNAIKQLLVNVAKFVAGATIGFIAASVLLFCISEHFKTQNRHKSLTLNFENNKQVFTKRAVEKNGTQNKVPIKSAQTMPQLKEPRKKQTIFNKLKPKRDKRFILFNDGGVVKLVLGTSYPIALADPVRSLSYFYNFHLQYMPPPIPLYPWSLYNTTTFPVSFKKRKREAFDESREIIYEAIKSLIERAGLPGEECLLQLICEITAQPFHVSADGNIFHEFLNAIFIPTMENVDVKYFNAFSAGHHGAMWDYSCPNKMNWLKRNTIFY